MSDHRYVVGPAAGAGLSSARGGGYCLGDLLRWRVEEETLEQLQCALCIKLLHEGGLVKEDRGAVTLVDGTAVCFDHARELLKL